MNSRTRSFLVLGVVLIAGGLFMIAQISNPQLKAWWDSVVSWPVAVVLTGVGLFLLGLILNVPSMAIPASIVAGIGLILYYQNASANWASWAYMWALIPGFVGFGILLAGLLGEGRHRIREGLDLMLISLLMYAVFAALFIPLFGGPMLAGPYAPAVLFIVAGTYVIIRGIFSARKKAQAKDVES